MGRESLWTDAEDAILLRTTGKSAVEVNRQLTEAGYEERDGKQIKRRRNYLRRQQAFQVYRGTVQADDYEQELIVAMQKRRELTARREALEAEIATLNDRIHSLLAEVQKQEAP